MRQVRGRVTLTTIADTCVWPLVEESRVRTPSSYGRSRLWGELQCLALEPGSKLSDLVQLDGPRRPAARGLRSACRPSPSMQQHARGLEPSDRCSQISGGQIEEYDHVAQMALLGILPSRALFAKASVDYLPQLTARRLRHERPLVADPSVGIVASVAARCPGGVGV